MSFNNFLSGPPQPLHPPPDLTPIAGRQWRKRSSGKLATNTPRIAVVEVSGLWVRVRPINFTRGHGFLSANHVRRIRVATLQHDWEPLPTA